jgi:phage-related protein
MPLTEVVFFAEADGSAPLLGWLDEQAAKVRDKCIVRIERLAAMGHELRRPLADVLRDGIYELRVRHGHVNYRVLYFFCGGQAVVSHGLRKEDVVPDREIDLAVGRKAAFEQDPARHTYRE